MRPGPGTSHASLLLTWSARRVWHRLRLTLRVLRLAFDWVTALYFFLPVTAGVVYAGYYYLHGDDTAHLTAITVILPHVTLQALLRVVVPLLLLGIHLATTGYIPFGLEAGDRLYVQLSPLRKRALLMTLYVEGWLTTFVLYGILGVVLVPLMNAVNVSTRHWLVVLFLAAGYVAALRLFNQLWRERPRSVWTRWLLGPLIRVGSALPITWVAGQLLTHRPVLRELVWLAAAAALTVMALRYVVKAPWDGFVTYRPSQVMKMVMPRDPDDQKRIYFSMRRPSRWLVEMLEQRLRVRLSPLSWLILIRGMRRQGGIRYLGLITTAVLVMAHRVPAEWLKVVCAGFGLVMVQQWWNMMIRPLYEGPARDQHIVSEWSMKAKGTRLMLTLLLCTACLWLVLYSAGVRRVLMPSVTYLPSNASMSTSSDCGVAVGAYRFTTCPDPSTRNFVKFHLMASVPSSPGACSVKYLYSGCAV